MNYTPEQIASIVLKVLKEIETPDVSSLSHEEKIKLARNPNAPQESLKVLATDENSNVRCCVGTNPNTPQETLKVLVTDEDYWVRHWVRYCVERNPNYKKQTLELTSTQHEALKKLIESGQDESLKGLMDT